MRARLSVSVTAIAFASFASSARAHHPLEATYDARRTVTLIGVVTGAEWVNPHTRVLVQVKGATGETTTWSVELDPPRAMTKAGMGPEILKQGDEISVDVWLAKDGSASATGRTIRTSDGTVYVASAIQWVAVR